MQADQARVVSVYVDGSKRVISTGAETVQEALERLGVTLAANDQVEPALSTALPSGFFNINVYRAKPVLVVIDGQATVVQSASQSPKLLAAQAGYELHPEDTYEVGVVDKFLAHGSVGQKVIITPATPVQILADGKSLDLRTQAATVAELLQEKKLPLGEKDTTEPALSAPISEGLTIRITRVTEVVVTKPETLPRAVKTISDPELAAGHRRIVDEGADGQREVTYRINYHNGEEVGRQVLQVAGLIQPRSKVIAVGTKITDDVWYRLRLCESGNNYSRNSGNGYYGAYQFDLSTWQSNGGNGYPHQADPATQDEIARRTQARRGWYPWPTCARKLGLI